MKPRWSSLSRPARLSRHVRRIAAQLPDERGRRVLMVSHCLLDENTRYPGGAFRPGAVDDILGPVRDAGVGLYQLPCPEQRAWGGVERPLLLSMFGARGTLRQRLRKWLLPAFTAYTRWMYARLARRVGKDMRDLHRAGVTVTGFVGVGTSPSCGVRTTLDLPRACEVVAACRVAEIDRELVNQRVVSENARPGEGIFVAALRRLLPEVPMVEHDLLAEMRGERRAPEGLESILGPPPTDS